jgi:hypothetical protein
MYLRKNEIKSACILTKLAKTVTALCSLNLSLSTFVQFPIFAFAISINYEIPTCRFTPSINDHWGFYAAKAGHVMAIKLVSTHIETH